tara:strand:+ start:895 stop:1095 length:201 start_codon:yes stop_codon:yes gene_type:complete
MGIEHTGSNALIKRAPVSPHPRIRCTDRIEGTISHMSRGIELNGRIITGEYDRNGLLVIACNDQDY